MEFLGRVTLFRTARACCFLLFVGSGGDSWCVVAAVVVLTPRRANHAACLAGARRVFFFFFFILLEIGVKEAYTFVCVPVFVRLQNADFVLTSPLRFSQHLGLACFLRPNPTRFGQEGEIAGIDSSFCSVFDLGSAGFAVEKTVRMLQSIVYT